MCVGMYVCMECGGLIGTHVSAGYAACDVLVSSVPGAELRCADVPVGKGAWTMIVQGLVTAMLVSASTRAEACCEVCGHLCCDTGEYLWYQRAVRSSSTCVVVCAARRYLRGAVW